MCFAPQRRTFFARLNCQKCSGAEAVCTYLDNHNAVRFFNISTSQSGPNMWWFYHFNFDMCFAPQRCARFWHLHVQKCSDTEVLLAFWLPNMLHATGVQFFICHLPKWLRTRRFCEPTFRIGKTQCLATSLPFRALRSSTAFLFSDSSHLCFSICPYCQKFDF